MEPVFKQRIWGGDHLRKEFGYNIPSDNTGECWGIAAHDNGSSVVKNGKYKGKTLKELFEEKPELFGNIEDDRFPLLVKILYAKEDSSIQVHPDDDYAIKNENGSLGKSECWYILDCDDNAEIMLGHNAKTREELKEMIEGGKWDAFISKVPIKKGDLIQIDPGTVHTITGGLMILEIQQNSDVTYRVYDYDRLQSGKPRELHIKESIDVITVPEKDKSSIIRNYNDIKENEMVSCVRLDGSIKQFRIQKLFGFEGLKRVEINEAKAGDIIAVAGLMDISVGETVTFGRYKQGKNGEKEEIEWQVLAKNRDKALLISKYCLDCKPYNTEQTDVTWETSTLRNWLNGTFYNEAFNSEEKPFIQTTNVTADKNPGYKTDPGKDTQDKVFLLSIKEAKKYFISDAARYASFTDYAEPYAEAFMEEYDYDAIWWWLRSPGYNSSHAAYVNFDGGIYTYGYYVYYGNCAVRPALWIDISNFVFYSSDP